jgi:hypothetical protein
MIAHALRALTLRSMLLLLLATSAGRASERADAGGGGAIAVVVSPDSPLTEISASDLKAVFQGYGLPQMRATNIILVHLKGEAEDRFNGVVLGLSSRQVRAYWLKKVFQGEGDARKYCRDAASVVERVSGNRSAIGFMYAADLVDQVRALRMDSRTPAHPDYLLR